MKVYFKITDIVYEITGDIPELVGPELTEYLYQEAPTGKHRLYVNLEAVEEFPPLSGDIVYQGDSYMILKPDPTQTGWLEAEHRIYISKYGPYPSACYIENADIQTAMARPADACSSADIRILYLKSEHPVMDMTFMEYFSIDRHLACEKAFILHSCYIEHEGQAVIFTAPSGTGKSTQGNLWTRYAGAHIINGDRCILKLEDDGSCQAYSLPFCGSSSINHDRSYPVKAIVFLAQGPANVIRRELSIAFLRKMMSQTTFSAWAQEATFQVIDIYDHFMKQLPFLQYACTPDQSAVETLRDYLTQSDC